ncbi:hypothetical protein Taro_039584 [Colocasia esculenta]|uniref:Uncharacterized protein n=1 Tax=Colocasia esculenta TaxID=4460 RepID=A0A843WG74_COLES|nr:hypothetical protein [Colocasia esculenta]
MRGLTLSRAHCWTPHSSACTSRMTILAPFEDRHLSSTDLSFPANNTPSDVHMAAIKGLPSIESGVSPLPLAFPKAAEKSTVLCMEYLAANFPGLVPLWAMWPVEVATIVVMAVAAVVVGYSGVGGAGDICSCHIIIRSSKLADPDLVTSQTFPLSSPLSQQQGRPARQRCARARARARQTSDNGERRSGQTENLEAEELAKSDSKREE